MTLSCSTSTSTFIIIIIIHHHPTSTCPYLLLPDTQDRSRTEQRPETFESRSLHCYRGSFLSTTSLIALYTAGRRSCRLYSTYPSLEDLNHIQCPTNQQPKPKRLYHLASPNPYLLPISPTSLHYPPHLQGVGKEDLC